MFGSKWIGRGIKQMNRDNVRPQVTHSTQDFNRMPTGHVQGECHWVYTTVETLTARLPLSKPGRLSRGDLGKAFSLEIRFPGNKVSTTDEAAKNAQSEADTGRKSSSSSAPSHLADDAGDAKRVDQSEGGESLLWPLWYQAPANDRNPSKGSNVFFKSDILTARFMPNFSTTDSNPPTSFLWHWKPQKSSTKVQRPQPRQGLLARESAYLPGVIEKVVISHLGASCTWDSSHTLRWPRQESFVQSLIPPPLYRCCHFYWYKVSESNRVLLGKSY